MMNPDPLEELAEVYADVQVMEQDFKKTLGVCGHLLGHSKKLLLIN